jgi:hypothetical protein
MTVLLPLPLDTAGPVQSGSGSSSGSGSASATGPGRPFATAAEPEEDAPALEDVVRRVRGARRIVVICGKFRARARARARQKQLARFALLCYVCTRTDSQAPAYPPPRPSRTSGPRAASLPARKDIPSRTYST